MLLNYFDDLLQVVVGVLVIKQPICQLFQGLKKAIQVHLVVVAAADYVLVNYIVVGL